MSWRRVESSGGAFEDGRGQPPNSWPRSNSRRCGGSRRAREDARRSPPLIPGSTACLLSPSLQETGKGLCPSAAAPYVDSQQARPPFCCLVFKKLGNVPSVPGFPTPALPGVSVAPQIGMQFICKGDIPRIFQMLVSIGRPQGKPTDSPHRSELLSNDEPKPNENPLCPGELVKNGSLRKPGDRRDVPCFAATNMGKGAHRNPETSATESHTPVISDSFCEWLACLASLSSTLPIMLRSAAMPGK
jgi:hypothetical protein